MKNLNITSSIRRKLLFVLLGVCFILGIFMSYVAYNNINTMLFIQRLQNASEGITFTENLLFSSDINPLSDIFQMQEPSKEYARIEELILEQISPTKLDRLTVYRPEPDGTQTLLFDIQFKLLRDEEDYKWEFVAGKNVSIYDAGEIIVEKEEEDASDNPLTPQPQYRGYSPDSFNNPLLVHDSYVFVQAKFFREDVIIKAVIYRASIEEALWSGVSSLLLSTWGGLAVVTLVTVVVAQRIIARPINRLTGNVIHYQHGDGSRIFFEDVKTNDEIEILSGAFGSMVDNIEAYIKKVEELCETYYKFVPVQFLEYLGKQEISDIELGDAKTMNFAILFCDIRGFSQKSEQMSAVENFGFVNRVFGVAGPIIRKYDGFIDKYIGDSVMALFPDIGQSVSAGIELYTALTQAEDTCVTFDGEPINIGVGIHSGTTMIGIVGEHMRLSGTVISDTVNLASRLEGITKHYKTGMIISSEVANNLPDRGSEMRWLGVVKAVGLSKPCGVYEVLKCLPPSVQQKRLETKTIFERSLHDFHAGNIAEASLGFAEVIARDPEDTAARIYAEYIASPECMSYSYIAFSEK